MGCTTCLNTINKIYIKTTESCQLHCRHCYIGDNRNKKQFFDEDATIEWLKNNIDLTQKIRVSFHGGEPFLCPLPKIEKVCKFLRQYPNITIDATTNLVYDFDKLDDIIAFVKEYFIDDDGKPFIKTSFDEGDIRFPHSGCLEWRLFDDNGEYIGETFVDDSIYTTIHWTGAVTKVVKSGIKTEIITCLTKPLIEKFTPDNFIGFMELLSPYFTFERLTENTTADKSLIPKYEDVDNWLYQCYQDYKKYPNMHCWTFDDMRFAADRIFYGCRNRTCMKNVITINPDGTLGGCPNSAVYQTFGSIYGDYDIDKRNKLIQSEHKLNPKCLYCDLFKYCNGDCCQLSWQGDVCPSPKKTFRSVIDDVERKKKTIVSDS